MKKFKKVITLFIGILLLLPLNIAYASTGSYYIDTVNIDAIINEDSTINVVETQEYRFDGKFNGVYRDFFLSGDTEYEITDVTIIDDNNKIKAVKNTSGDDNTYETYEENEKLRVKVYTKSEYESKKLVITYKLHNSNLYLDENNLPVLYWNFYSVENVDSIKNVTLSIGMNNYTLSQENTRYDTYGDGDLNTNYNNGKIYISYNNLTSLLGIQATLPNNFFTVNLPTKSNSDHSFDLTNTEPKDDSGIFVTGISILIVSIIAILVWIMNVNKKKFNEALEAYRSGYIFNNSSISDTPPNNASPALVNILINEGKLNDNMIIPSLFYLVNNGYYTLTEQTKDTSKIFKSEEKDLLFKRNTSKELPKEKHLRYLINWFNIYSKNDEFSLIEIKKIITSTSKAEEYVKKKERWEQIVKEDADSINMFHTVYNKEVISNEFIDEKNLWNGYKTYISRIFKTDTLKLDSLNINNILLYALALNLPSNDIDHFCKIIEVESSTHDFHSYPYGYNNYYYMYSYYPLFLMHMNEIQNNSINNSVDSTSSGGGFGGGFSGGGFSGGGGGGGGAF